MTSINLRESWNRNTYLYHKKLRWSYDDVIYSPWGSTEDKYRLLGDDLRGKRILEVGCGGGQATIVFAKRGAIATGLDIADEQIKRAREMARREGVQAEFFQSDAEDLSRIPSNSQDIVFSSNVFDYVENLDRCFREVARVLVEGGIFVFCVLHPFYRFCRPLLPEPETKGPLAREHTRELISYHKRGRFDFEWIWGEEGERIPMYIFRRTAADFFNTLVEAGFIVDRMIEPEPDPEVMNKPWLPFHPYEHVELVPDNLVFKCHKPTSLE